MNVLGSITITVTEERRKGQREREAERRRERTDILHLSKQRNEFLPTYDLSEKMESRTQKSNSFKTALKKQSINLKEGKLRQRQNTG